MNRGKVKWFNENKGYGFIEQDSGPDVFVHYTAIEGDGFRTLSEGEEVEFEMKEGEKGLQASRVVKLYSLVDNSGAFNPAPDFPRGIFISTSHDEG